MSPFAGSFSYGIAIEVPPFHGLEPRLSLGYSSEGRNGFVGVGWGLSGFSTVERRNPALGTPSFKSDDIYVLDGQELVPCGGGSVSPSCTTGGTHSTKIESYLRIKFDSSANTWTIWGRDGTKTTLSPIMTAPANPAAAGGTFRWGQSSTVDTLGNTVSYTWSCTAQEDCYPSEATYNGYKVTFFKETRPDLLTWAGATFLGQTKYRLRSVFVWLPGTGHIRAYKLGYTTSPKTGRSLLSSVQQFGKDVVHDGAGLITGGTSLPAQTFNYYDDASGYQFVTQSTGSWNCGPKLMAGDFNGDGITDQACDYNNGANRIFHVRLALPGGGLGQWVQWLTWTPGGEENPRVLLGDYNGDGRTDFGYYYHFLGTVNVALSWGGGFGTLTNWGTMGGQSPPFWQFPNGVPTDCRIDPTLVGTLDFNGDGITDVFCSYVGGEDPNWVKIGISNGTSGFTVRVLDRPDCDVADARAGAMDFDGDGKDDWYCIGAQNNRLGIWTSNGTTLEGRFSQPLTTSFCSAGSYQFADVNGDGRTDVFCPDNGNMSLSMGRQFQNPGTTHGALGCSGNQVIVADLDGDGAAEIGCNYTGAGSGDIRMRRWHNNTLQPVQWSLDSFCADPVVPGDYNGDGKTDLACTPGYTMAVSGTSAFRSDLLGTVANGLGGSFMVSYTPATRYSNANNPGSFYAVSSSSENDGRGNVAPRFYWYSGGKSDRVERRFLGFRVMLTHHPALPGEPGSPRTVTYLKQDLANAGSPEHVYEQDHLGRNLRQKTFVYTTNGATVPRVSNMWQEWTYDYDPASGSCPSWPCSAGKRTYTGYVYDGYGNRVQTANYGDYDASGDEVATDVSYRINTTAYPPVPTSCETVDVGRLV